MLNRGIIDRCRAELMRTARAGAAAFAEGASPSEVHRRGTITYARLAALLGVANQSVGLYLDVIYEEEIGHGRPDLTTVVVYEKTGLGRYNSRGAAVRSKVVVPGNLSDERAYRDELNKVYGQWA